MKTKTKAVNHVPDETHQTRRQALNQENKTTQEHEPKQTNKHTNKQTQTNTQNTQNAKQATSPNK